MPLPAIATFFTTKRIIAFVIGGAVVAGGAGYLIKDDEGRPIIQSLFSGMEPQQMADEDPDASETEEEATAEPKEQTASVEPQPEIVTPAPEPEPEPQPVEGPKPPVFDLLRVEKDGSVVMAGSAPPGSEIEIMDNGQIIAQGKVGPNGDFAIVFDAPLTPGDHELSIIATTDDGDRIASAETGIVTIPEPDKPEQEVLAMVQTEGEASRVLQKPEVLAEPVPEKPQTVGIQAEPERAPGSQPQPEPEPELQPAPPVMVEAVDVETDRMFVAGRGKPGNGVRIYIDNEFMGQTRVGQKGAFLLEIDKGLTGGSHTLRADMLPPGSNEVSSRASVIVEHELEPVVTAAAPQPAETPEPEATQEPESEPVAKADGTTEVVAAAQPEAETQTASEIPVIQTGRSVIIRRGDNLWRISRRLLGEGKKYTIIFAANDDQIEDPDLIFPGQVFDVPDSEPDAPASSASTGKNAG
jgi:nucleoid-associated protein YgaU